MQGADMGMLEGGDGLASRTKRCRRSGRGSLQDFDGDRAIEAGIARLVDGAHAPLTEHGDDLVVADVGVPAANLIGGRHRLNRAML